MILVLTGTHHQPFDRLVAGAEGLAQRGERVVVQTGVSAVLAPSCEARPWWAPDALTRLAQEADVVVCHGGPGSAFLAWDAGKVPVMLPREARFGEHVDDHQVAFAAELGDRAVVCRHVNELARGCEQARRVVGDGGQGASPVSAAFAVAFEDHVATLLERTRRHPGVRGRLRRIFFRMGSPAR